MIDVGLHHEDLEPGYSYASYDIPNIYSERSSINYNQTMVLLVDFKTQYVDRRGIARGKPFTTFRGDMMGATRVSELVFD